MNIKEGKSKTLEEQFDQANSKWFPLMNFESRGSLNDNDFIFLRELLKDSYLPLKEVRDKSLAHWDNNQPSYEFDIADKIIIFLKEYLSDLFYLQTLSVHSIKLDVYVRNKNQLSKNILDIII